MKLPTPDAVAVVLNELPSLSPAERNLLAAQIGRGICRALELEKLRRGVPKLAAHTRRNRLSHLKKTLTASNNADYFLTSAISVWNAMEISVHPEWFAALLEAKVKLDEARISIECTMNNLLPFIHPALETAHEEPNPDHPTWSPVLGGHDYPFSHLRAKAIEYWLISFLDFVLAKSERKAARRHILIANILAL